MLAGNHWMIGILFAAFCCHLAAGCGSGGDKPPYLDTSLSVERRVDDLIGRMTLEEKASQMLYTAASVERLGVPEYNWWNECLHGVARAGRATVFPQAIGMAATWDEDLLHLVAAAISDEGRAKHHEFVRQGKRGIYQGLTFWTPNINIFRDPRWGRGMETYGEDPYLTGRMGVAFVRGIQGDDPDFLKAVATVKHFAVHSGPESERHTFDAVIDERDLRETYLPHFRMCIEEGGAYSLMGAYNRYLGEACCASDRLLGDILRGEWGFDGYVVSDCWALHDIFENHKLVATPEEAAAMAVKAGCDLNCGYVYENLVKAVGKGLLTEADIDRSVKRLFTARFRLGMFDPPEKVPYTRIPYSVVDSAPHRELARETARKSIVLLKNDGGLLPLKKDIGTIAVIGPNADEVEVLLANYNGRPADPVTPLRGIREKVAGKSEVLSALGCEWAEGLPKLEAIPESSLFHDEGGALKPGLRGEYFNSSEFEGDPAFTRIDGSVDFDWGGGSPRDDFDDDNFGVRWTGFIVPAESGRYALGAYGSSGFRLFFRDEAMLRYENPHEPRADFDYVDLEAGKRYPVTLEFYEKQNDAFISLLWSKRGRDLKREALGVARKADAVIMVMGLSPRLEGEEMKVPVEGFDRGRQGRYRSARRPD